MEKGCGYVQDVCTDLESGTGNIYDGCKIENRCNNSEHIRKNTYSNCEYSKDRNDTSFTFERKHVKKNYTTKQSQNRTSYVVNEKYVYEVVCKVEL